MIMMIMIKMMMMITCTFKGFLQSTISSTQYDNFKKDICHGDDNNDDDDDDDDDCNGNDNFVDNCNGDDDGDDGNSFNNIL